LCDRAGADEIARIMVEHAREHDVEAGDENEDGERDGRDDCE
jgi:hypothetical protein